MSSNSTKNLFRKKEKKKSLPLSVIINRIREEFSELSSFRCPITKKIFRMPSILIETGQTFEKDALDKWLKLNRVCPSTGKRLTSKNTCTNFVLVSFLAEKKKQFLHLCNQYVSSQLTLMFLEIEKQEKIDKDGKKRLVRSENLENLSKVDESTLEIEKASTSSSPFHHASFDGNLSKPTQRQQKKSSLSPSTSISTKKISKTENFGKEVEFSNKNEENFQKLKEVDEWLDEMKEINENNDTQVLHSNTIETEVQRNFSYKIQLYKFLSAFISWKLNDFNPSLAYERKIELLSSFENILFGFSWPLIQMWPLQIEEIVFCSPSSNENRFLVFKQTKNCEKRLVDLRKNIPEHKKVQKGTADSIPSCDVDCPTISDESVFPHAIWETKSSIFVSTIAKLMSNSQKNDEILENTEIFGFWECYHWFLNLFEAVLSKDFIERELCHKEKKMVLLSFWARYLLYQTIISFKSIQEHEINNSSTSSSSVLKKKRDKGARLEQELIEKVEFFLKKFICKKDHEERIFFLKMGSLILKTLKGSEKPTFLKGNEFQKENSCFLMFTTENEIRLRKMMLELLFLEQNFGFWKPEVCFEMVEHFSVIEYYRSFCFSEKLKQQEKQLRFGIGALKKDSSLGVEYKRNPLCMRRFSMGSENFEKEHISILDSPDHIANANEMQKNAKFEQNSVNEEKMMTKYLFELIHSLNSQLKHKEVAFQNLNQEVNSQFELSHSILTLFFEMNDKILHSSPKTTSSLNIDNSLSPSSDFGPLYQIGHTISTHICSPIAFCVSHLKKTFDSISEKSESLARLPELFLGHEISIEVHFNIPNSTYFSFEKPTTEPQGRRERSPSLSPPEFIDPFSFFGRNGNLERETVLHPYFWSKRLCLFGMHWKLLYYPIGENDVETQDNEKMSKFGVPSFYLFYWSKKNQISDFDFVISFSVEAMQTILVKNSSNSRFNIENDQSNDEKGNDTKRIVLQGQKICVSNVFFSQTDHIRPSVGFGGPLLSKTGEEKQNFDDFVHKHEKFFNEPDEKTKFGQQKQETEKTLPPFSYHEDSDSIPREQTRQPSRNSQNFNFSHPPKESTIQKFLFRLKIEKILPSKPKNQTKNHQKSQEDRDETTPTTTTTTTTTTNNVDQNVQIATNTITARERLGNNLHSCTRTLLTLLLCFSGFILGICFDWDDRRSFFGAFQFIISCVLFFSFTLLGCTLLLNFFMCFDSPSNFPEAIFS